MAAPTAPASSQAGRGGSCPIIVTAELEGGEQAWLDGLRRRHFPVERNHVPAHVTLFHHLPPSDLAELQDRVARIVKGARPEVMLARFYSLGKGVALQVDSPGLMMVREELAEAFAGLLTPQDGGRPRFHVTIQNKVAPDMARATLEEVMRDFRPRRSAIAALAVWKYRGGPWELVRRYAFRG